MGSIDYRPRQPAASAEQLQELFFSRLRSERVEFVTLSAALARAEDSATSVFEDLHFRAHRLKGVAATFDYAALALAAGKLEQTCIVALHTQANHNDGNVWAALIALVHMLGNLDTHA